MVDVAQLVRALDCGSRGRGFDPHRSPIFYFIKKKHLYFYISVSFLYSCITEPIPIPPIGTSKIVILNEGNFGKSNSSISLFDVKTKKIIPDIFQVKNKRPLGDVSQSIYFDSENSKIYVVVNNSNKIEVLDTTFNSIKTIQENLSNPRYMMRKGNYLYITNWGKYTANYDLDSSYLLVVDVMNYTFVAKIQTGKGAEFIMSSSNSNVIYISNSWTNTLSIININTFFVIKTLEVGDRPAQMIENGSAIWLLCSGGFDSQYNPKNNASFYKISNTEATKIIDIGENTNKKIFMDVENQKILFTAKNTLKSLNMMDNSIATKLAPQNITVSNFAYNPLEKIIYFVDQKGFKANSVIYRYGYDDSLLIDSFEAGIGTNSFIFFYQ